MEALMTKELAKKIVAHYKEGLKAISTETDVEAAKVTLDDMSLSSGICCCANEVFNTHIYYCPWVCSFQDEEGYLPGYWFKIPDKCDTMEEIFCSLNKRIDRLEMFIKTIVTDELVKDLISVYQEGLLSMVGITDILVAKKLLKESYLDSGICYCSNTKLGISIYNCAWVKSFNNSFKYWFRPPMYCTSIPEITESLQNRIDRLKTFL